MIITNSTSFISGDFFRYPIQIFVLDPNKVALTYPFNSFSRTIAKVGVTSTIGNNNYLVTTITHLQLLGYQLKLIKDPPH
jgi:hypothetical protein